MALTEKRRRFDEYLKDLNGKQAAIRAGYARASAEVEASRLLRDAKVAEAIEELLASAQGASVRSMALPSTVWCWSSRRSALLTSGT